MGIGRRPAGPLAVVHPAGSTRHASVLPRAIAQSGSAAPGIVAAKGEPQHSGKSAPTITRSALASSSAPDRHRAAPPAGHSPFLTARHVWLHTDPPLDLDVDGEIRGRTPAQITLEANALRVMVAADFPDV